MIGFRVYPPLTPLPVGPTRDVCALVHLDSCPQHIAATSGSDYGPTCHAIAIRAFSCFWTPFHEPVFAMTFSCKQVRHDCTPPLRICTAQHRLILSQRYNSLSMIHISLQIHAQININIIYCAMTYLTDYAQISIIVPEQLVFLIFLIT